MSFEHYTKEQLKEMSMIELASELLQTKKQAIAFQDIMEEIITALGLTEAEVKAKIAQFYTDLNVDGRFISLGENRWGLRAWYPVDQIEEEITTQVKPKKKKAKKVVDEDIDEIDEIDEEIEYDDLEEYDDDDEILEDEFDEIDEDVEEFEDDELIEDEDVFEELEDEDENLDDEELDDEEE